MLVGVQLFLIGMTCASLQKRAWSAALPDWMQSAFTAACVTSLFLFFASVYRAIPCLLLGLAFLFIVSGCSLFGVLRSTAAKRLGNVSYGIYLLQGLVLTSLSSIPAVQKYSLTSPYGHWLFIAFAGLCLIAISTLAHVYVERPGIALGKRLIELSQPRPAQSVTTPL